MAVSACANCVSGKCFDPDRLFMRGETDEPPCFAVSEQHTIAEGGINCDHFLLNVLPADPELMRLVWAELNKEAAEAPPKYCAVCGKPFIPSSNRQRFCMACAKQEKRKNKARRAREYRANASSK